MTRGWTNPGREVGSAGSIRMRPATESGSAAACSAATRPPIELPTRMAGGAPTASQEATQQPPVALDVRGPAPGRGQSVPHQVEGHHPRVPAQGGADGRPVEVGPAEAVDPDQEWPVGRPAHVQVVDRSVDVDGAGPGAGWPRWGHRTRLPAAGREPAPPPSAPHHRLRLPLCCTDPSVLHRPLCSPTPLCCTDPAVLHRPCCSAPTPAPSGAAPFGVRARGPGCRRARQGSVAASGVRPGGSRAADD